MRVEILTGETPDGWDALVALDSDATFFHTEEWSRVLSQARPDFSPVFLTAFDHDTLVGGIPIVCRSLAGSMVVSSMPYGTYGGPVLHPEAPKDTTTGLLRTFSRIARSPRIAAAHLTDLVGRVGSGLAGFRTHTEMVHVIDLTRPQEDIWAGLRPSARNKVRKARRAGVSVRRATSLEDFLAYHDMLVESSRRWGVACEFGSTFFAALHRLGSTMVQMWLAEYEGSIVAGDLNFVLHGRIMNWGNVSRTDARRLAPNNLLHAVAIEEGAKAGCSVYDLGSSAGIAGVDAFKSAFGTTLVPITRYSAEKVWYRVARAITRGRTGGRR